jgi:hypothetical protein
MAYRNILEMNVTNQFVLISMNFNKNSTPNPKTKLVIETELTYSLIWH